MKTFKKILIVVLIIIALPLIIALFVPREYNVERDVVINRPEAEVFDYIKYIKNQDNYSVWNQKDPAMKKDYTGTDGSAGFKYHWNGNDDVGEGIQEITNVIENERIEMDLHFKRPWEGEADTWMTTDAVQPNSTKVTWGMKGESSYPMNFMNLFMGSMLGNDLQQGLDTLKVKLEQ
ncbi:SRPBCC family protein [Flavobacterium sp. D11R37]|uniref:SRPBCC family protein n=1 Tax=Flavobacterium coralii TaxID=2838017 RepID=UPI001CA7996E|nr:SRPBCC family protein [Flavobacterium coralii]MBY8962375.1 SRPBCC family protein [Flavobacterium coralii]